MNKAILNREALTKMREEAQEQVYGGEYLNVGKLQPNSTLAFFLEPLPEGHETEKLMGKRVTIWLNKKPTLSRETLDEHCPGMELINNAKKSDDPSVRALVAQSNWANCSVNYDFTIAVRLVTFEMKGSRKDYTKIAALSKPTVLQMDFKAMSALVETLTDDKYEALSFIGYDKVSLLELKVTEVPGRGDRKTKKYEISPMLGSFDIDESLRTPAEKLTDCWAAAREQVPPAEEIVKAVSEFLGIKPSEEESLASKLNV